ncbi:MULTISPECIES: DUF3047 domain-containing protein [Cupriavidus]|nr:MULTISPECIES: DUF3047 domain-containing protein [Cupriavidus]MCA7083873.1 DUF3047 domain-containing protein [Cupriavidus sp. DB3]
MAGFIGMGLRRPLFAGVFLTAAATLAGCATSPSSSPDAEASASKAPKVARISPMDCRKFHQRLAASTAKSLRNETSQRSDYPAQLQKVGDQSGQEAAEPMPLQQLPLFSTFGPEQALPAGWHSWTVNRSKTPTQYALTEVDQRVVLHARADGSASGLYVPLKPREPGKLRWAWKTRDVIADGDNASGPREDAPLRVFVAFDGDKSTLSLKDHLMDEMARLMTGREMPYATLMYIWGAKRPEGTVIPNPHTERVRMIVVDSGTRHARQWRCHERDLRADYRAAFGKEPGRLLAVGIMTDTDNTRSQAEAWYGDIALD